jgi:hypothetical protein
MEIKVIFDPVTDFCEKWIQVLELQSRKLNVHEHFKGNCSQPLK